MIGEEKKSEYWDHFTGAAQKNFRPKRITDLRLKQIKKAVFGDDFFWRKFFNAPDNALDKTPAELREASPPDYRRARATFWALIGEKVRASLSEIRAGASKK